MARYSNVSGTPSLAAQNSVMGPIRRAKDRRPNSVTLSSGSGNHASCLLVLQGSSDNVNWADIDLIDPDDAGGAVIEGVTGPGKSGVAPLNASSFEWFQVKRSDGNAGAAIAFLSLD